MWRRPQGEVTHLHKSRATVWWRILQGTGLCRGWDRDAALQWKSMSRCVKFVLLCHFFQKYFIWRHHIFFKISLFPTKWENSLKCTKQCILWEIRLWSEFRHILVTNERFDFSAMKCEKERHLFVHSNWKDSELKRLRISSDGYFNSMNSTRPRPSSVRICGIFYFVFLCFMFTTSWWKQNPII